MTKQTIWMSVAGTDTPDILKPNIDTLKAPPARQYNVILKHDDYTPPGFVAQVLQCHFKKPAYEAFRMAAKMKNDRQDVVAGTYSPDVAETIHAETMACAVRHEHPLQARIQPV